MKKKVLNITLPEELVRRIDVQAKWRYETRSEYLRRAAFTRLEQDEVIHEKEDVLAATYDEARRAHLKKVARKFHTNANYTEDIY